MFDSEGCPGGALWLARGQFIRDALKCDIRDASSLSTHYEFNLWDSCVIHKCLNSHFCYIYGSFFWPDQSIEKNIISSNLFKISHWNTFLWRIFLECNKALKQIQFSIKPNIKDTVEETNQKLVCVNHVFCLLFML